MLKTGMDAENINALSTAIIAFITFIATAVGFYYNLRQVGTKIHNILILEGIFFLMVWLYVVWVRWKGNM